MILKSKISKDKYIMEQNNQEPVKIETEKKPNENAGYYFLSSIKIYDPNTQEVLVQKRGDD